jgi:hypothetical protein
MLDWLARVRVNSNNSLSVPDMSVASRSHKTVFKVLDAMDAPHGGRLLKLRLQSGDTPTVRELRGARMQAKSPDGEKTCTFSIDSVALFGGRAPDERLARSGRIDVQIKDGRDTGMVGLTWLVSGPIG